MDGVVLCMCPPPLALQTIQYILHKKIHALVLRPLNLVALYIVYVTARVLLCIVCLLSTPVSPTALKLCTMQHISPALMHY